MSVQAFYFYQMSSVRGQSSRLQKLFHLGIIFRLCSAFAGANQQDVLFFELKHDVAL